MDIVPDRSRVGPFVLEAPLGHGSSGSLHRALDTRVGHRVALRWSGSDVGPDPGPAAGLADEAAALAASAHPHVVALRETGECDGRPWLALALVDGPDLRAVLGGRPMLPGRAAVLLTQLAAAVDAVHAAGFVHLDLKPANVLVTRDADGGDHVVLADFGLARRVGPPGSPEVGSGDFVGSPAYAAPEHLRGDPVGPRADVYAFTCVAVACLIGRPPHAGSVAAVVQAHHAGVVPPTGLGPDVDGVVRCGMAADPEERFGSAGDAARALVAVLAAPAAPVASLSGPTPGPSPDPPRRLRDPVPPTSGAWADRGGWPSRPVSTLVLVVLVVAAIAVVALVAAL